MHMIFAISYVFYELHNSYEFVLMAVVGLMDRALDLKPEVTQGCGFESRLRQEVHDCSPGAAQSAGSVYTWMG